MSLSLALPRDNMSVPVARSLVDTSLRTLGATEEDCADVALALTEACTNVLKHSGPGDAYEVRLQLEDTVCSIDVVDVGHGFDASALGVGDADDDAERGRGVQLMRALMDCIRFESKPQAGSIVRMVKVLDVREGTLVAKELDRTAS